MTLIEPERVRGELRFEEERDGSGRVRQTKVVREEGADGPNPTETKERKEGERGELRRVSFFRREREQDAKKLTERGVSYLHRASPWLHGMSKMKIFPRDDGRCYLHTRQTLLTFPRDFRRFATRDSPPNSHPPLSPFPSPFFLSLSGWRRDLKRSLATTTRKN